MDATLSSGLGRFVNDSPSKYANCIMKKFCLDGKPNLFLVTKHAINAMEELRYDYGDASKDLGWRKSVSYLYGENKLFEF